jgi:hypothetical protein
MDQAIIHEGSGRMELTRAGRRSGWSDMENKLLWETADEAQQQGLPLKAVFEQIARQTGRRPNSIRNYYYAQVREHDGDAERPARFVPFTQQEVDWLMEQVLVARSAGQSVRSCLQKLSGGDHSLMLRYQNKYRAVIKSRPEYVQQMVDRLKEQGVECDAPQVNHRTRADLQESGEALTAEARRSGESTGHQGSGDPGGAGPGSLPCLEIIVRKKGSRFLDGSRRIVDTAFPFQLRSSRSVFHGPLKAVRECRCEQ